MTLGHSSPSESIRCRTRHSLRKKHLVLLVHGAAAIVDPVPSSIFRFLALLTIFSLAATAAQADAAATVVANLLAVGLPHPLTAVVCVLRDKDWRGILTAVARAAEKIVVTLAPTAPAESRSRIR